MESTNWLPAWVLVITISMLMVLIQPTCHWDTYYKPSNIVQLIWSHHHHHHHDVRLARISLILSLHISLSFIAFGRSSGLHNCSQHTHTQLSMWVKLAPHIELMTSFIATFHVWWFVTSALTMLAIHDLNNGYCKDRHEFQVWFHSR